MTANDDVFGPGELPARELRLADTVRLFDGPFGYALVTKITDEEVTLFRPYAVTADFEYTGGVIPYVGFEDFRIHLGNDSGTRTYFVAARKALR